VVTRLEYSDSPVAVIVHDAALREEPELLESITGAARIALERDKLLVEVKARAERYRAVLQAMPDLMFRISREGTVPRLQRAEYPRPLRGSGHRAQSPGSPPEGARRPCARGGPGRRRPRHPRR
jgi:hypothetical protein